MAPIFPLSVVGVFPVHLFVCWSLPFARLRVSRILIEPSFARLLVGSSWREHPLIPSHHLNQLPDTQRQPTTLNPYFGYPNNPAPLPKKQPPAQSIPFQPLCLSTGIHVAEIEPPPLESTACRLTQTAGHILNSQPWATRGSTRRVMNVN